jgi:prepilin-type processing-associated H-X9-DG protein
LIHGAIVAGEPEDFEYFRRANPKIPSPSWLAEAISQGNGEIRIALAPTPNLLRFLEKQNAMLPPPLGGGPAANLLRTLKWASLRLTLEPQAALHVSALAADHKAAMEFEKLANVFRNALGGRQAGAPEIAKVVELVEVKVDGSRLASDVDLEQVAGLLRPVFERQRLLAKRMRCVNNLKQIMLAMHNYHDANGTFPPAFLANQEGKPLLSWRVLILPYLGEQALYQEFHLDEPWSSPHNKALISRIPDVYKCADTDLPGGRTTYLTPRGKSTIFPGGDGISIDRITDGTSNTIAVLEVDKDHAVGWTVPDDWEIDDKEIKPATILKAHPDGGSNVGFSDGSVRFLKGLINPEVFGALLSRAGGEVIAADAF